MFPHPDSLRSRYAAKSGTASQEQHLQPCSNHFTTLAPLGSRIGSPNIGNLGTPRNFNNFVGAKETGPPMIWRPNTPRDVKNSIGSREIGAPLMSRLSTPRDVNNSIGSKERDLERQLLEHGITPIYQPEGWISEAAPNVRDVDLSDVRTFVSSPAPKACGPIRCYIRRRFRVDWLFPRFELYLTDGDRFLLSARKRKKSIRSNYILSLDQDDISRKTGNFFGKIQSNFLGTEFWFYDKGARQKLGNSICLKHRAELGAVTYEKNVLGLRGPRKLTAIIPSLRPEDDKPFVFQPILPNESHSMITKYLSGHDQRKMLVMHNKKPVWNKQLNAYCLNFQGRVTRPSVKNFQLVTDAEPDYIVLQFGKVSQDLYNLDYQHPMSALQAFAICLTSLDFKLGCE